MYYVLTGREDLLHHLPKGATGAEIGVAEGAYSAQILERADPRELHLIDPWSHLEAGSTCLDAADFLARIDSAKLWKQTFSEPPANSEGDRMFAKVEARFAGDPRVRLHRQYSYKLASTFPPAFFDFVYLDGNHQYEFVLRDLQDFAERLKPDGLLFGHDFFEDDFACQEHYGVVDAVGTFLKRSDFRMIMLSWEPFSTFCLARGRDGFAGRFLHNVLESDIEMIELPGAILRNYRDKAHRRRNGSQKRIPSFAAAAEGDLS